MIQMQNFTPTVTDENTAVYNPDEIPHELNIFYRSEEEFLPPNKTFKDLTPEELTELATKYRFDPMKPGMYQTITGFGNMI